MAHTVREIGERHPPYSPRLISAALKVMQCVNGKLGFGFTSLGAFVLMALRLCAEEMLEQVLVLKNL